MNRAARARLRKLLFRVSVSLKGLDGGLEIVTGLALLVVRPDFILRAIALLTQDELREDRRDLVANYALAWASQLSVGTQHFAAYYLLSHGVIKLALVGSLLKNKLWAFPAAIVVFAAYILYQLYRFTFTHSPGLIALSVFDAVVIWLIALEYRAVRQAAAGPA